ncbi:unnamed protein product [Pleuronectes platessa]|uniref:Uncharacterized protein n=1 Tax=Pleuronectes platessa TaxID=8262 RepID=A0A9N7VNE6_PLEPL|nr:unnamed protein product [Pleuronectes platessa]
MDTLLSGIVDGTIYATLGQGSSLNPIHLAADKTCRQSHTEVKVKISNCRLVSVCSSNLSYSATRSSSLIFIREKH